MVNRYKNISHHILLKYFKSVIIVFSSFKSNHITIWAYFIQYAIIYNKKLNFYSQNSWSRVTDAFLCSR